MKDDWFVVMYKFESGHELEEEFLELFEEIIIETPVESSGMFIVETTDESLKALMDDVADYVEASPVEMEVYSIKVDRDSIFQEI